METEEFMVTSVSWKKKKIEDLNGGVWLVRVILRGS